MSVWYSPDPIPAAARGLASTDFSDGGDGNGTIADGFSHAKGRICVTCDREIAARDPARRRGENGWAHDVCPISLD
jgi:hypothetical protein